ncbi:response regulator [Leptolyngbya sp. 'hensonii']|uniref:response regulator n=1 Tax=Leptolyngbya sp. 'hensonii' TaxID=1922337 RepID=UPI00094F9356|nr:response regulator [Leptolyngbya sp. 'hensonii']
MATLWDNDRTGADCSSLNPTAELSSALSILHLIGITTSELKWAKPQNVQPLPFPAMQSPPLEAKPLILLAEDNEANSTTLASYLENQGYQLIIARNGVEAVAMTFAQKPQLVIMDIQMPEMDGLEAIRQIRQHPEFLTTPIIALTALAMPRDQEQCLAAGATEYLSKPVRLKELVVITRQLLADDLPETVSD